VPDVVNLAETTANAHLWTELRALDKEWQRAVRGGQRARARMAKAREDYARYEALAAEVGERAQVLCQLLLDCPALREEREDGRK
jgi:hypothetical protein